jgi:uncharacterized membrane protein YgaE (UPF0421/DUF939 family)
MDALKTAIATFLSCLAAYIAPVQNAMFILTVAFVADIL